MHPDIVISSIDGEEANFFCHCRASGAKRSCPRCLGLRDNFDQLSMQGPARTVESMRNAYEAAREVSGTAQTQILQDHGLHLISVRLTLSVWKLLTFAQHFLWEFGHSCPYTSYGYDLLHVSDLGEWGTHLWNLLCDDILKQLGQLHTVNDYMARFPTWPGLKHFYTSHDYAVTDIDFSDGNTFVAILQVSGSDES